MRQHSTKAIHQPHVTVNHRCVQLSLTHSEDEVSDTQWLISLHGLEFEIGL